VTLPYERKEREEAERAPKRKVLDLTLVQVVASALATVVGAVLASLLGVTGTIIGAAVISTSATTGAAVFSHAFRRTGEGIRSRVPSVGVPSVGVPRTPGEERAEHRADARAAFGSPADATAGGARPPSSGGESVTTYRGGSRWRSIRWRSIRWKRYALATGLVFALAMLTLTAVELIAGKPVAAVVRNEQGSGTSVGGGTAGSPAPADSPTPTPAPDVPSDTAPETDSSAAPDASATPEASSGTGFSTDPSASPSDAAPSTSSTSSATAGDGAVNSSDATPR